MQASSRSTCLPGLGCGPPDVFDPEAVDNIILQSDLLSSAGTQSHTMSDTWAGSIRASNVNVSENSVTLSGRPSRKVILKLAPTVANITSETGLSKISPCRLVLQYNPLRTSRAFSFSLHIVLLAYVGPLWHSGCLEQNCAGNDPERSAGVGCNPVTGFYGAFDSLETAHSPLEPPGSKRKRGSGFPGPSKASTKRRAAATSHGNRSKFACHYYLRDRIHHCDCLNKRLARLADVRQHLLDRKHKQVVHCPVCGSKFEGPTTLAKQRRDTHVQAATCERSPFPFNYPGITEDEEQRIRQIARDGRTNQYTEVERWYKIWDVLFPGQQRPESPFLTDVPDIQRMVDWTAAIFGSDLWLELPIEPWTTAMSREERHSLMSNFIQQFIVQVRSLEERNGGSAEEDHGAENFSHIDVGTPDPSGATVDLGVVSLASFDSTRPADRPVDALGPVYLSPLPFAGSRQAPNSRMLGQTELNPSALLSDVAPIPFRIPNDPAMDVSQGTQQGTAPGPTTGMHDPAPPSLVFQDFSVEALGLDFSLDWEHSMFGDHESRMVHDHAPADEDELEGSHQN